MMRQVQDCQQAYDVIIVGCGPAGCTVARGLSPKLKVLIVDRSSFPRYKVCGGLISPSASRVLRSLGNPPKDLYAHPRRPDIEVLDLDHDRSFGLQSVLNVWRDRLDSWLLQGIPDNIELMQKTRFVSVEKPGLRELVTAVLESEGKLLRTESRYLVGAEGASLSVRRVLDPRLPSRWVGLQEWIEVESPLQTAYVAYKTSVVKQGIIWAIPKDGFLVVGGLFAPDPSPKREFETAKGLLLASLGTPSSPVAKREAGQIVKVERLRDIFLGRGRVLLVGESAGLISASTGEGMSFALISGQLCAEAINTASNGEALEQYRHMARKQVLRSWSKVFQAKVLMSDLLRRFALKGLFGTWRDRTKPVVEM